jgi:uncharacterized protein (DUF2141 family)
MRVSVVPTAYICAVLCYLMVAASGWSQPQRQPLERCKLTIEITHLRVPRGSIWVAVFDDPKAFPSAAERAVFRKQLPVEGTSVRHTLELPPGTYAISYFHDENGNNAFDTNFLGIPREGYGASNNALPLLSAPVWKDSHFTLRLPHQTHTMKTAY